MKRYILFYAEDRCDGIYDPFNAHDSVDAAKKSALEIHKTNKDALFRLYDKETDQFIPFRWWPAQPPGLIVERQMRDPKKGVHKWERDYCLVHSAGPNDTREWRYTTDSRSVEQRVADYLHLASLNPGIGPWWDDQTENWPGTPWSDLP